MFFNGLGMAENARVIITPPPIKLHIISSATEIVVHDYQGLMYFLDNCLSVSVRLEGGRGC